jgi:N-acetylglucosamine-6-phosphate deacetylase
MLTLAPELANAARLIEHAVRQGIVVSLGHTLADTRALSEAADAGATALTHLGNGVPNILPRHLNPIWAGLAEDRLSAMIITDGHHLPPELIKTILRAKGGQRCIVVSDASPMAGMPPGRYETLGNQVVLEPDGKLHNPEKGCLVGSSANISQCIAYLEKLRFLTPEELDAVGRGNAEKLLRR